MGERKTNIGLKVKIIGLLSVVLVLLLSVDIAWTYQTQKSATESMLLEESRVLVTEMDAVWDFVSINQDTINYTLDGTYEYKGLHCAIAGKSVAAFFSLNSDYTIRFTKDKPRNFHNAPDDYEAEALSAFDSDATLTEHFGLEEYEGQSVFRYVSAMKVDESCIECHGEPAGEIDPTGYAKEGWDVGDLAGAVSVIVPTDLYFGNMHAAVISNVLFFLCIILCMVVVIYFVLTRLITNPLERLRRSLVQMSDGSPSDKVEILEEGPSRYASREVGDLFLQFESMARSLSSLYSNLENQVSERTQQLSEANDELQRQRRHVEQVNDKLQRDNRYKSDFLAIVSHELRTPLTSILAFTDLMSESVSCNEALARRQLEEIDKNGRILLEMVDNVLETARIQAGSERLNLELVDLSDMVGMVEASSASLAAKKDVALSTRVDADVPLLECDWEKVRRILVNLVSNAIKFTEPTGSVHIAVSFDTQAQAVTLKVIDTGVGIPADKQDIIFERFTQENMSTVRRYGGSGLGLSLVKDLASMHGGVVGVESVVGAGSTFFVVLPVREPGGDSV